MIDMAELTLAIAIFALIGLGFWVRHLDRELGRQRRIARGLTEHMLVHRVAIERLLSKRQDEQKTTPKPTIH